jgi:(E)-4-hydroxy-3-methylbut-2-enyl-diphosphate synthase
VNALEQRLEDISEHMDVAVIGCVVNGPGEAREADVGLAGGQPNLLYIEGKPSHKVGEAEIVDEMERQVRAKVALMKQGGLTSIPVKLAK